MDTIAEIWAVGGEGKCGNRQM